MVDDGRRYLERTGEKFDVIAIDPPPPVNAAASSLLYSEEFYAAAKRHLQPGGILPQWLPGCDDADRGRRNARAASIRSPTCAFINR